MKARRPPAPVWSKVVSLSGWIALGACGDPPTAPAVAGADSASFARSLATPQAQQDLIGVFGVLEEARGSTLIIRLAQPRFEPRADEGWYEPPIGGAGELLEVLLGPATRVLLKGQPVAPGSLTTGVHLLMLGTRTGERLVATMVTDLTPLFIPATLPEAAPVEAAPQAPQLPASDRALTVCVPQELDFGDDVDEFQGCWGDLATSWTWDTPAIQFGCGAVGCFELQRLSFTVAAGGWQFAFPFRFRAEPAEPLVYHVPGSLELDLEPLDASSGDFTFAGGLGVDMGVDTRWCTYFDLYCYDLGTYHLSPFSTIHQATGRPPFTGEVMGVEETGCPGIPVPQIPGLSVGMCTNLEITGAPFHAFGWAHGTYPDAGDVDFDGPPINFGVRPNATSIRVRFDEFRYVPNLGYGFYLRLRFIGVKLLETPQFTFIDQPFYGVTTPYPNAEDYYESVPQPTSREIVLDVLPAPTRLTVFSSPFLAEGHPVRARLVEAHDGRAIEGRPVTLTVVGEGESVEITGSTDPEGEVAWVLPNGEYAVTATFAGEDVYLPSEDKQQPVFIYMPSSFVVWGGNHGGVEMGERYLFWGNQWWKQVTGGDFRGNSSFKGYSVPTGPSSWASPPANAAGPPTTFGPLIGVIVSTSIHGRGAGTTGNVAYRVIMRTVEPESYTSAPGHPRWGVARVLLPDEEPEVR